MKLSFIPISLLALAGIWACKTPASPGPVPYRVGFDWQGHRGCRGLMPENSIPAFQKALDYPAIITLELDLAVSRDQQLIVSHEPWFNPNICRTPAGDSIDHTGAEKKLIGQLTVAEIQAFDCGSWGHPGFPDQQKMRVSKPVFSELVEAIRSHAPNRNFRWNIEIKSQPDWDNVYTPPVEIFAQMVCREIRRLNLEKQSNVQSFDRRMLRAVHRILPEEPIGLLVENEWPVQTNLDSLGFTPQAYSPYFELVTKKTVKDCHARGMRLIPWTVNEAPEMRRLIGLGVDGIITDYPNLIQGVGK